MQLALRIAACGLLLLLNLEARASSSLYYDTIYETSFDIDGVDASKSDLENSGQWSFYSDPWYEGSIKVGHIGDHGDGQHHHNALILSEDDDGYHHHSGGYTLNEAILTLDLSGYTDVRLGLNEFDANDEEQDLPNHFYGHEWGDGLSISDDGNKWHTIWSPDWDDSHDGEWEYHTFDLESLIADHHLDDRSQIHLKFQQKDNYPLPYDGRAFDNIVVSGVGSGGSPVVPEPASLGLFAAGLTLLGGYRLRRRRSP